MPVTDELPRLCARCSEPERVDDVVEPHLELAEQTLTGDAGLARGTPEVEPELLLEQTVDAFHFLLFAKLQSVSEDLGTPAAVLAGGVVTALDRALVLEAAVPFEK